MRELDHNSYVNKKRYIGKLYLFIKKSKNSINILYQ